MRRLGALRSAGRRGGPPDGAIAIGRPYLTKERDYPASIPQPPSVVAIELVTHEAAARSCACTTPCIDTHSERALFQVETYGKPTVPLRLALTRRRLSRARRTPGLGLQGRGDHQRRVPAPRRDVVRPGLRDQRGTAPRRDLRHHRGRARPGHRDASTASPSAPTRGWPSTRPSARRSPSRLPTIVSPHGRSSGRRSSAWLLWPLAVLFVLGVPAAVLVGYGRGAGDDEADASAAESARRAGAWRAAAAPSRATTPTRRRCAARRACRRARAAASRRPRAAPASTRCSASMSARAAPRSGQRLARALELGAEGRVGHAAEHDVAGGLGQRPRGRRARWCRAPSRARGRAPLAMRTSSRSPQRRVGGLLVVEHGRRQPGVLAAQLDVSEVGGERRAQLLGHVLVEVVRVAGRDRRRGWARRWRARRRARAPARARRSRRPGASTCSMTSKQTTSVEAPVLEGQRVHVADDGTRRSSGAAARAPPRRPWRERSMPDDLGGARAGEQRAAVADAAAGVEHRAPRDELGWPTRSGRGARPRSARRRRSRERSARRLRRSGRRGRRPRPDRIGRGPRHGTASPYPARADDLRLRADLRLRLLRERARRRGRQARRDRSGRVLDVGCGAGGVGRSLRAAGAERIVGIEIHAPSAERARADPRRGPRRRRRAGARRRARCRARSTPSCSTTCSSTSSTRPRCSRRSCALAAPGRPRARLGPQRAPLVAACATSSCAARSATPTGGTATARTCAGSRAATSRRCSPATGWPVVASSPALMGREATLDRLTRGRAREFLALQWHVLARR